MDDDVVTTRTPSINTREMRLRTPPTSTSASVRVHAEDSRGNG